jgi:predicted RNase H-like HicB family nuclease
MLYPVYVHLGDEGHAHGVTIPDFPGCFSAADDWQDLPRMVQEAIEVYCEGESMKLPAPTPLETLARLPEFQDGGVWLLVEVDTTRLDTRPVRLNISLPAGLAREIDDYARAHGATRSGFLAEAARNAMR